jgi:hypothetical protein
MALHIDYCNSFGVSKEEMEAAEESEGMHDSPNHVWRLTKPQLVRHIQGQKLKFPNP